MVDGGRVGWEMSAMSLRVLRLSALLAFYFASFLFFGVVAWLVLDLEATPMQFPTVSVCSTLFGAASLGAESGVVAVTWTLAASLLEIPAALVETVCVDFGIFLLCAYASSFLGPIAVNTQWQHNNCPFQASLFVSKYLWFPGFCGFQPAATTD